tara:strand:+ start:108 stop:968 length:861 start_codon:yes stop_codon:yes gene_type:complete
MKNTMTEAQLKQIIKEEVLAQEGLMDFLRDPTGRKARAKIADLEKEIAQASSEAEKLKAEKSKAALEKAAEEQGLLDKEKEAYAQASAAAGDDQRQREEKYSAALKKLNSEDRDFINDFLDRRAHFFDMAQEFEGSFSFKKGLVKPEMTLDGRTLRKYVFVRAPQDAEEATAGYIEKDAARNRGITDGTIIGDPEQRSDKRAVVGLMGAPAYFNYNNGNILIIDPNSNVYVSYADYRDKRYKGDLNQNALFRTIVRDLEDRGYKKWGAIGVPMSPENVRSLRGKDQ